MKAFLNRIKATFKNVVVNVLAWSIVGSLFIVGLSILSYKVVTNKVRGAVSWITNSYNSVIESFKTEITEETSKS